MIPAFIHRLWLHLPTSEVKNIADPTAHFKRPPRYSRRKRCLQDKKGSATWTSDGETEFPKNIVKVNDLNII